MAITKIQSESLNLADDYAFTGTITGAGESNVPSFSAYRNTSQGISDRSETKYGFNAEHFDTDGAFDTSTNTFTVPTGQGGKYFIGLRIQFDSTNTYPHARIRVNGSITEFTMNTQAKFYGDGGGLAICNEILNLSEGDTVAGYVYHETGSTSGTEANLSRFFGFKISS